MPLLENHLVVKRSTLPGAGKGLFTKAFIAKGSRIIEYKGIISSWKDADQQDGANCYIYYVNRNHVIDGYPFKKEKARYANDARGLTRVKGITNNCQYIQEKKRVFIEAIKNIPPGSEILVGYSKEYWDVIKLNKQL